MAELQRLIRDFLRDDAGTPLGTGNVIRGRWLSSLSLAEDRPPCRRVRVACQHKPASTVRGATKLCRGPISCMGSAPADAQIACLAAAQHGVVALGQLRPMGLGNGAIYHRLRSGRLHPLHRGVFAVGHARVTQEGRWMAAVLALGDGAALSHLSAAALWGLRPSAASRIHVTVPTSAGRERRPGLVVHRCETLRHADVSRVRAIAVTSVARTLLDIAGTLAPGPLERAVEQSLILRLFDLRAVNRLLDSDRTRAGARTLQGIIDAIHDEPPITRSELEAFMRDLCDAHGLPRPQVNANVDGEEVDFLWREQRLIVETDGHATHGTRPAFERDRARDARLTLLGYRVVRFTHRQLAYGREHVAATVIALLAALPV